jgi:hypothetical protein
MTGKDDEHSHDDDNNLNHDINDFFPFHSGLFCLKSFQFVRSVLQILCRKCLCPVQIWRNQWVSFTFGVFKFLYNLRIYLISPISSIFLSSGRQGKSGFRIFAVWLTCLVFNTVCFSLILFFRILDQPLWDEGLFQ